MDNYDVEDPAAVIVKDTGKVAFRFCPEWYLPHTPTLV
jgi:hypothetical protein